MTLETAICLADQWWGWTATCLPLRTGEWRGSCASVRMDARNVPLLTTTDTEQWRHTPDAGGSAAPPAGRTAHAGRERASHDASGPAARPPRFLRVLLVGERSDVAVGRPGDSGADSPYGGGLRHGPPFLSAVAGSEFPPWAPLTVAMG